MKTNKTINIGVITKIGLFTAIAFLLAVLEFPLWFAPDFYTFDLSSAVALLGSYFIGPLAGIIIAVLKTVLKALVMGTTTAFVGEYVDIIITILYIFPAAITYRNTKTNKGGAFGMLLGILFMTVFGCILNYFLLIPIYARIIGMPVEMIVNSVSALNSNVNDLKTLVLFITAPFNVFKGVLCSAVAFLCLIPLKKITRIKNPSQDFALK